jgi:hypothetical protein
MAFGMLTLPEMILATILRARFRPPYASPPS